MSIQNYVDMTIESDIFAGARDSFDLMMQKLLHKMQQNASDEGSITLKVSVDMTTEWIPDGNGESEECFKPKIKYKVDYAGVICLCCGSGHNWRMWHLWLDSDHKRQETG